MKKAIFFGTLLFASLFVGCKDSNDDNVSEVGSVAIPSGTNFQNLRKAAIEELTIKKEFTVDGEGNIEFTSTKGVKVSIPEECLNISGASVSGTVQVEFVELFDKAPLLTTNIATMGWDYTDNTAKFLITGGAFLLKLTQNGQEIESNTYCIYTLDVPASLTGGLNNSMVLWYGNFNENGDLIWEKVISEVDGNPDREVINAQLANGEITIEEYNNLINLAGNYNRSVAINFDVDKGIYQVFANRFGWTNIDVFYDDTREKTALTLKVPSEYHYENSAMYISYKNIAGISRTWYYANEKAYKDFSLPIGLELSAIFVSESNGKWVYAIKNITVSKDLQVEFLKSDLKEATQAELEAAISQLQ